MNKKKGKSTTVILIVILLAGLSLLLYPSVSNYWNSFHQTQAITEYSNVVDNLSNEEYDRLWQEAVNYNNEFAKKPCKYDLTNAERAKYNSVLDVGGSGVMGTIEIPSLRVNLPIYHGVADEVLQIAVGHVEWSSLPVGGSSTHCVLSGHRGLPSAKLFTHLDEMVVGDVFMIRVLDEILTYEVDQILIVEPEDTKDLQIEEGKDYCTLLTCTPYGINTHRLLVRGHRIETVEDLSMRVTADAVQMDSLIVASIIGVPLLLILLIIVLLNNKDKDKTKKKRKHDK